MADALALVVDPRHGPRFWAKAVTGGREECWNWTAYRTPGGYGMFQVEAKKWVLSHRVAYALALGEIPPGACVCHSCDNPSCCNPAHLFLGTHADNIADRDAKGRQARGDRHGSHTRPESRATGVRNGRRTKPESTARGEVVGIARLSTLQVQEIRSRYSGGGVTSRGLAGEYGVNKSTILRAIRGETWGHSTALAMSQKGS